MFLFTLKLKLKEGDFKKKYKTFLTSKSWKNQKTVGKKLNIWEKIMKLECDNLSIHVLIQELIEIELVSSALPKMAF